MKIRRKKSARVTCVENLELYICESSPELSIVFPFVLLKGQCHKIFDFCFFHESFSPKPMIIPLGPFQILSKICRDIRSSRCTTGVVDTSGKWKKSSILKFLIILFGHLWEVELTYRYFFAFKFTLMSQQPDIVPIICHQCH